MHAHQGFIAVASVVVVLAGAGGFYTYTQQPQPVTPTAMTAASTPLDTSARILARYKASASATAQSRHAAKTAAHKAAAREAARIAVEQLGSGGPGPDTPTERACVGDEDSLRCAGVEQRDVADHYKPTLMDRCPSGAATSPECDQLIKGGEPNMQPPKCGDGSLPAYLRAHGLHCK